MMGVGINGKVRGDKDEVLWGKDRGGLESALHSSGTGIKESLLLIRPIELGGFNHC